MVARPKIERIWITADWGISMNTSTIGNLPDPIWLSKYCQWNPCKSDSSICGYFEAVTSSVESIIKVIAAHEKLKELLKRSGLS